MRTIGNLAASLAGMAALTLAAAACSSSGSSNSGSATTTTASSCKNASQQSNVAALPGFQVCLWAASTSAANHPDDIAVHGSNVFIGWQDGSANNGSNGKSSKIIQYNMDGKQLHSWSAEGHVDGLAVDPTTNMVWATANEDGNAKLYIINTSSNAVTKYNFPPAPHMGGFDAVQFVNGVAYSTASNPTLNSAAKNPAPSLYKLQVSGSKLTITPVLSGQPTATTLNPPITKTKLNLTDPDSMQLDTQGDLVMNSQGDSLLLFIKHVGTSQQSVSVLPVGTPVDDTPFAPSANACLLVSDNAGGVYSICSNVFVPGQPYASVANDSPVASFVGTLSLGSGTLVPIVVGIGNPHGMVFIPR